MACNISEKSKPKVIVIGLASCFGCQLQMTNREEHLLDILNQVDLQYWQLTSSLPLPQEFDIAIIEGAVTTTESLELLQEVRQRAKTLIAIGACAVTGGVPSMAAPALNEHAQTSYDGTQPAICGELLEPKALSEYVDVDYIVRCCPIDTEDFVRVLQTVLAGSNRTLYSTTMCTNCKINNTPCLYEQGKMCLGLVTDGTCGARCVELGRECRGCAGLSADANVESAVAYAEKHGFSKEQFVHALSMFNSQFQSAASAE